MNATMLRSGDIKLTDATVQDVAYLRDRGVPIRYPERKKHHRSKKLPATNSRWTVEEEEKLLKFFLSEKKPTWTKLARELGRTVQACKKRYYRLVKKMQKNLSDDMLFSKNEIVPANFRGI